MPVKKLLSDYEPPLRAYAEKLSRITESDYKRYPTLWSSIVEDRNKIAHFLENEHLDSQIEPVCSDKDILRLFVTLPKGESVRYKAWIYQNAVYLITGADTEEEQRLLVLDFVDKERQKFERLKAKFSNEQSEQVKYERTRIPEHVRIEVWRRDQGKCAGCGSREKLEYDHIVPVSRGGSNTARNVELLCEECNRAKGDRIQ